MNLEQASPQKPWTRQTKAWLALGIAVLLVSVISAWMILPMNDQSTEPGPPALSPPTSSVETESLSSRTTAVEDAQKLLSEAEALLASAPSSADNVERPLAGSVGSVRSELELVAADPSRSVEPLKALTATFQVEIDNYKAALASPPPSSGTELIPDVAPPGSKTLPSPAKEPVAKPRSPSPSPTAVPPVPVALQPLPPPVVVAPEPPKITQPAVVQNFGSIAAARARLGGSPWVPYTAECSFVRSVTGTSLDGNELGVIQHANVVGGEFGRTTAATYAPQGPQFGTLTVYRCS